MCARVAARIVGDPLIRGQETESCGRGEWGAPPPWRGPRADRISTCPSLSLGAGVGRGHLAWAEGTWLLGLPRQCWEEGLFLGAWEAVCGLGGPEVLWWLDSCPHSALCSCATWDSVSLSEPGLRHL